MSLLHHTSFPHSAHPGAALAPNIDPPPIQREEMEVLSRAQARALGVVQYFTGIPCKHGHKEPRRVSNGHCLACDKDWFSNNGKYGSEYRQSYFSEYRERNIGQELNRNAVHRAGPAVPQWYSKEACEAFYARTPEGMTVDHVVPLKGKLVSGLHTVENLQYLSLSANKQKGNTFIPV